jgi:hypothetical protein
MPRRETARRLSPVVKSIEVEDAVVPDEEKGDE